LTIASQAPVSVQVSFTSVSGPTISAVRVLLEDCVFLPLEDEPDSLSLELSLELPLELLLDLSLRELEEFLAFPFPLDEDPSSLSEDSMERFSSCGAKLLSSSPHANRKAIITVTTANLNAPWPVKDFFIVNPPNLIKKI
jgi:hypothetical protein